MLKVQLNFDKNFRFFVEEVKKGFNGKVTLILFGSRAKKMLLGVILMFC